MDRRAEVVRWFAYGPAAVLLLAGAWAYAQAWTGGEGRALSRQEMLNTAGRECADCSRDFLRVDAECADDDSLGCASECMTIFKGTGNGRYVCDKTPPLSGLCKQRGPAEDIVCYRIYKCTGGPTQQRMECSVVSGNCVAGNVWCSECTNCQESPLPPHMLPNYWCDKGT